MDNPVLVAVTGFGSVWRYRSGKQMHGGFFAQPVYYNTTGVVVKGHVRQRPQICGYARFHPIGGFDPNHLSKMTNRVFECAEPSVWMGCNKLLFKRILDTNQQPECYLVVASSQLTGHLQLDSQAWRSPDNWLLSFSDCGGQQEAMLVVPAWGWIRTDIGKFVLQPMERAPWQARLVLCCED